MDERRVDRIARILADNGGRLRFGKLLQRLRRKMYRLHRPLGMVAQMLAFRTREASSRLTLSFPQSGGRLKRPCPSMR